MYVCVCVCVYKCKNTTLSLCKSLVDTCALKAAHKKALTLCSCEGTLSKQKLHGTKVVRVKYYM